MRQKDISLVPSGVGLMVRKIHNYEVIIMAKFDKAYSKRLKKEE